MSLFKKRPVKKPRKSIGDALLEEYKMTEQEEAAAQGRNLDDPKYKIGYGKGVRIGNFRLYKRKTGLGSKERLDCIMIANFEATWSVQIPATQQQYAMIEALYADYVDGKKAGLMMYMANMINVSLNIRADYQYLVNCIAQIYADPNGKVTKNGKEYTIIDAVANDVKWIGENVQSEYYRDKEDEENSKEAEKQLKKDETLHEMVDEVKKIEEKA